MVTGDVTQVDLPRHIASGLRQVLQILNDVEGISMTFFNARDVVRHPWCSGLSAPTRFMSKILSRRKLRPVAMTLDLHARPPTGPSHLKLGLDTKIALEMPGLPAATDFQRWASSAGRRGISPGCWKITIRIVNEVESAALNETYRHKQGSTNVLSFPFEAPPEVPSLLLGNIVICAGGAARGGQSGQTAAGALGAPGHSWRSASARL